MWGKIHDIYVEFKWQIRLWYWKWQAFSLKDYLKKKILKFLDLLQPENIYRRGHDIIAPKLIKKYMQITGNSRPSPETCTFINELVGWYCIGIFSIFFIAFILPEIIKTIAWSIFIGGLLLKYSILYVMPVYLFIFIIFKIVVYILTHWHFIVICFYLRAREKWKLRAHTSFKSESKLKKLRSRRRNKILLFFFFWIFIFYFGSYEMYVFATWNYLFWLSWFAYSRIEYVHFYAGINPAHPDYEELMQFAADLQRLNTAGPEELYFYHENRRRKKLGLPSLEEERKEKKGYYIFYKLNQEVPLIFKLNAIRMWWWDFLRYWPPLIAYVFIAIPDIIIFFFEWWSSFPKDYFFNHYFQGGYYDNSDIAWPLNFDYIIYCPWGFSFYYFLRNSVITILPEKSWSTPEEKLTLEQERFFIEELGYEELDFDEVETEDLQEEIENFQCYVKEGENFGPGELCWTWFYNREKVKPRYFKDVWTTLDGPAFVDRHEWGWEYYKFMFLGKFCSDCLKIEKYIMDVESIPLLVEFMDEINDRHTRLVDRIGYYYWRDDEELYELYKEYQRRCHLIVFWVDYEIVR